VGADYVLEKLPDVSGPGLVEAGRYTSSLITQLDIRISPNRFHQLFKTKQGLSIFSDDNLHKDMN